MLPIRFWLLAILLLGAEAQAEVRIALLRDDTTVARQAATVLHREFERLGWGVDEIVVADRPAGESVREGSHAIVALGAKALWTAFRSAAGRPTVGAMVARSAIDESLPIVHERWSIILLDQPVERWANLVHIAFPARAQIGTLVGTLYGSATQRSVAAFDRRFQEMKLALVAEPVPSADDVMPALERLLPRMNVFLALPDPLVHNRNTVSPLLLATYRAGIPVLAYSESYLNAGAAIALYSSVSQIGQQVMETLQQMFDGRVLPNVQTPRYYTVAVNASVARSLGLSLPTASEIQDRLRARD